MARKALATGTQLLAERTMGTVMPSGEDAVVSVVFDIQDPAGGFSMIPRAAVEESPATPANIIYYNVLAGSPVAAGTTITAAGTSPISAHDGAITSAAATTATPAPIST